MGERVDDEVFDARFFRHGDGLQIPLGGERRCQVDGLVFADAGVANSGADIEVARSVLRVKETDLFPDVRIREFRVGCLDESKTQLQTGQCLAAARWACDAELEPCHGSFCALHCDCHVNSLHYENITRL